MYMGVPSDCWLFLSTPSVGRATVVLQGLARPHNISIHALRGEGDVDIIQSEVIRHDFYPRPPWGGRPALICASARLTKFLSTPSVGRATVRPLPRWLSRGYFYPRPPWGGRPFPGRFCFR